MTRRKLRSIVMISVIVGLGIAVLLPLANWAWRACVYVDPQVEGGKSSYFYLGDPADPPIPHERFLARIRQLQNESLDELKETIYEDEWYEIPGVLNGGLKFAQFDVDIVFSNRRFSRLREVLKSLPPAEAAIECRKMLDDALARSDGRVKVMLKLHKTPDAPENEVFIVGNSMLGNKWGLSAVLLVAGELCDTRTVLDAIHAAEEAERKWLSEIEANPDVYPKVMAPAVTGFSCLETAFKINAISMAAFRDPAIPRATKAKLAKVLSPMEVRKIRLVPWNAAVTTYERVWMQAGTGSVDTSKGVEEIDVYHIPISRNSDTAWQQNIYQNVSQTITQALPKDGK